MKRTLSSSPSVLDTFYYPFFSNIKKSQNLAIFGSFEKLHKTLKWHENNGGLCHARHLITDEKYTHVDMTLTGF